MIRLGLTREPRAIELAPGVTVTAKPLTFAIYRAATYSADRAAVKIAREAGMVEAAGGTIVDIPDYHDREGIMGLRDLFMLQALARHAITEWTGIGDEDGNPVAPSPRLIDDLILSHPLLAARFEAEYLREIAEVAAEGNGSGADRNGISEMAPSTAGDAIDQSFHAPTAGVAQAENSAPPASTLQ